MLLRLKRRRLHKPLKPRLPLHRLHPQCQRRCLIAQNRPQPPRHIQIPSKPLHRPLIPRRPLEKQTRHPRHRRLHRLPHRPYPIRRKQLVLIRQHRPMALKIHQHRHRLPIRAIDPYHHQFPIHKPIRIPPHRGRQPILRPHAPVDINRARAARPRRMRRPQLGMRFHNRANNLIGDHRVVPRLRLLIVSKIHPQRPANNAHHRPGMCMRRSQPHVGRRNAGGDSYTRRNLRITRNKQSIDIHQSKFLSAASQHNRGDIHPRRVHSNRLHMRLRPPIQLRHSNRRSNIRPRHPSQKPGGRRVLRPLLHHIPIHRHPCKDDQQNKSHLCSPALQRVYTQTRQSGPTLNPRRLPQPGASD